MNKRLDTDLSGVRRAQHATVKVIAPFGNEKENNAQQDVTDIGEEVIKVGETAVGIGAGEIVIAHVHIASLEHHLILNYQSRLVRF